MVSSFFKVHNEAPEGSSPFFSSLDSGSGLYRSLDTVRLTVVSSAVLTVVTGAPWFGLEAVFLL